MSSENMTPEVAQTSAEPVSSGASSSGVETTEKAGSPAVESNAQGAANPSVDGQTPQAAPSWQPNYKFKAFDKEHELDPMFRTLIKDAETEKQVKSFASKAFALEPMKAEKERIRTEYETFKSTNEPTLRAVNQLNKLLGNKDYENFFKGLKIPDEDIFAYVQKKLDLMQMPPDQKAEWDKQNQIRMQNYQLENQYTEMQERYQSQMVESRKMEFAQVLSRPDVASYAQAWDQKAGEIGAFRNLVIDEAKAIYMQTGQDMSSEQAINHAIQKFGKIVQPGAVSVVNPNQSQMDMSQPGQNQYPNGNGQQSTQRPPIIPNVAGRGTSPVKKRPQNLEDLKALAKNM